MALSSLWLGATQGCGSVTYLYTAPHYTDKAEQAVKKVAVVSWVAPEQKTLGSVLSHVTADLLKLRKNYLVTAVASELTPTELLCTQGNQGVVLVRSLGEEPSTAASRIRLRLAVELIRCSDGVLIYRGEADGSNRPDDRALSELTRNYTEQLGQKSAPFVAPAFVILQQLIEPLYDPVLTETDIEEKIELGLTPWSSAPKKA